MVTSRAGSTRQGRLGDAEYMANGSVDLQDATEDALFDKLQQTEKVSPMRSWTHCVFEHTMGERLVFVGKYIYFAVSKGREGVQGRIPVSEEMGAQGVWGLSQIFFVCLGQPGGLLE